MKKIFTFLLSMLLILSLIPCFSLVSSLHEKEKLHISFSQFSEEELTEMTTGEDGYHIAVFVAFSYENMNDEALASLSTEAKRTAVSEYYRPRNEAVLDELGLQASASYYAPFAEIVYENIDAFRASEKLLRKVSRNTKIEGISADLRKFEECGVRADDYTNSDDLYQMSQALADVGITSNSFNSPYIRIGLLELGYPTISSAFPNSLTFAGEPESTLHHASKVCTVLSDIVPNARFYCIGVGQTMPLTDGFNWLISQNVDIINMSMTEKMNYNILQNLPDYQRASYDYASRYVDGLIYQTGCQIVIGAGNDGDSSEEEPLREGLIISPAYGANCITVGSSNKNNQVSYFSSYFCSAPKINKPDIVAPGERLINSALSTYILPHVESSETSISGTSFSAPMVVGIAARLLQEFPMLKQKPILLKAILMESCTKLNGQTDELDFYAGAGKVNYANARAIAQNTCRYDSVPRSDIDANGISFYPVVPSGQKLRIRMAIEIPGDTSTYSPDIQTNVVMSYYRIVVQNLQGTETYLTTTIGDSTEYLTYTNQSGAIKTLKVTIIALGNSNNGEVIAYTHNMGTCYTP